MKVIVSLVAAATALALLPATATAVTAEPRPRVASIPKAVVKASASTVTEGDRLSLKVRVPQAKDARRVVLQERVTTLYSTSWTDVDSKRARSRLTFRHTVTAQNTAVYRVAITYRDRVKPVVSRSAKLTVWRWIELREFTPYFQTNSWAGYGQDTMNGTAYATWGLHYTLPTRAWEDRITPGRNCTKFRAVLGLSDRSDDGSSGVISFATDETATIYQSPSLTPGMTVPVALELAKPYRFAMAATNTSADKVKAYPMVGNGAFYCTGI